MNCSHTVYRKSIVDVDACHVHSAILINNLHLRILVFRSYSLIQLLNIRNKLGNDLLQVF